MICCAKRIFLPFEEEKIKEIIYNCDIAIKTHRSRIIVFLPSPHIFWCKENWQNLMTVGAWLEINNFSSFLSPLMIPEMNSGASLLPIPKTIKEVFLCHNFPPILQSNHQRLKKSLKYSTLTAISYARHFFLSRPVSNSITWHDLRGRGDEAIIFLASFLFLLPLLRNISKRKKRKSFPSLSLFWWSEGERRGSGVWHYFRRRTSKKMEVKVKTNKQFEFLMLFEKCREETNCEKFQKSFFLRKVCGILKRNFFNGPVLLHCLGA